MNLQESIRRILREETKKISLKSILTKIDPPSILHHYSSSKNRDSILKRGLLPKIGERTKNFIANNELNLEPVPLIFAQDPKHGNFFGVYGNDIWEIDLTKLDNNWYKDPIHEKTEPEWYFYVTTEPIPPSAIKLIGSNEEADKAKEIYLKTGKQPKIDLTPEEKERIKKEKEAEELKAKQDKEFNELPDDVKNMDIGDLMNLQENIRRILREEDKKLSLFIRRRYSCYEKFINKLENGEIDVPIIRGNRLDWNNYQIILTAYMRNYCESGNLFYDEEIHQKILDFYEDKLYQWFLKNIPD